MDTARLRRKRIIIPTVTVAVLGIGGVAWASTGGAGLQSGEADQAGNAATQAVGGGTVTEVESDDDLAGGYEVEVKKSDGTTVDVTLDKDLKVLNQGMDDSGGESEDRSLSTSESASAEKAAVAAVGGGTVSEVEASDHVTGGYDVEVHQTDGTEVDVVLGHDLKVVSKTTDDSDDDSADHSDSGDRALSDSQRSSAEKAAVAAVGDGTVTDVEAGDDGDAYEVEVQKADGTKWEVTLDSSFKLLQKSMDD